jgi:hypothetical protein
MLTLPSCVFEIFYGSHAASYSTVVRKCILLVSLLISLFPVEGGVFPDRVESLVTLSDGQMMPFGFFFCLMSCHGLLCNRARFESAANCLFDAHRGLPSTGLDLAFEKKSSFFSSLRISGKSLLSQS